MENAIEIENLTRKFSTARGLFGKGSEKVTVVDDISFNVKKGELFGFLGPNGAGKTTTIKILTTVLLPTAGRVQVLGNDVIGGAREIRRQINVVYGGDKGLYTRLSARDNLKYFCDLYRIESRQRDKKVEQLLELVNLTDAADRRVENYSRGMRQRLHIARGLINDPQILFLDEPTIGLDPVSSLSIRKLVKELKKRGVTIFLTTHYMQEVEEVCDRIAIIKKGKIVAIDKVENIKSRFKKSYFVKINITGKDESEIQKILHTYKNAEIIDKDNHSVYISFGTVDILKTLHEIVEIGKRNLEVVHLDIKSASLEDAYIDIVSSSQ